MKREITNEMLKTLINAYESNKDSLYELDGILDENGILDNGITDIHDTFEMGYNNALQYVFSVLDIRVVEDMNELHEKYYEEFVEETCDENGEVDNNYFEIWLKETGRLKELF